MQEVDEYQIATTRKRAIAFFIDDIIVSIFLIVIFFNQLSAIKDPTQLALFLQDNLLAFMLLRLVYQTFFVWQNGMTPGKMFLKIKVVDIDTSIPPSFVMALLRSGFRIMSESLFYIGYLMAYFNPLVQTLHDKMARTIVVNV
jgi:uncharacterized RDD family membrane protein YckC